MRCSPPLAATLLTLALAAPGVAQPTPDEAAALAAALAADATAEPAPPTAPPPPAGALTTNPDIALILDVAATAYDTPPAPTGAHDPGDTGFHLQQLEMHLSSNVDPYFRLDANLVFSAFGVEVEEAYGTTLALPAALQLRAGQFLTRFGRHNPTHPHAWRFADQPLVMGKFFGAEGSRGLGLEASWLAPLPWYTELVASATSAAGACCARSYYNDDPLRIESPADLLYTTALKQFWALGSDWSLGLGLSAQLGPNASGPDNRSEIYGADLLIRYRDPTDPDRSALTLRAEGLYRTRQIPRDRLADYGGVAELVYSIDAYWETGARYDYVRGLDGDPLDPDWTRDRHRYSAQITYYPSHFSRVRLQGNHDRGGPLNTPSTGLIVALELLIGAHGAHTL